MQKIARLLWFLRHGVRFSVFVGGAGFLVVALLFVYYFITLPPPQDLTSLQIAESTKIYDRTGETVLYDVHGEYRRTIVPIAEIPDYMVHATIAAEDNSFYRHFGIDMRGILRAVWANVRGGGVVQGGSTITQQFIKNAFLSPERTIGRKIKEAILAVELELRYSKEQIISWYLNQVPYGSNAYGAEAAAQTFFGKSANEISIAESAFLAALPQAPTFYSPYGNNPEALDARKDFILSRMHELGYITEEQYEEAVAEEIDVVARSSSILAPHFVFYVLEELEKTYGKDYLQSAGLQITTSLDWDLQQYAQERARERAAFNEKNFNGENVAAVALDPRTGEILAMVGSRDYFDEEIDGNVNVATRLRQPGSSFKPFAYAAAFAKGYTPDTVLLDVPTEFNPNCSYEADEEIDQYGLRCYSPQNYTETFMGPITMKEALAQSVNVPSVKTLYLAGVQDTLGLAQKMGITSLTDPSRYGLSLVLGGGEVTLLEETAAYGIFATRGEYTPPQAILSITNTEGEELFTHEPDARRALDEKIADQITSILSSNELRAPVFGARNALHTPAIASAAKTGTTQNFRDAWTVGYTNDIAVGVWAGNNDGTHMVDAPGSAAAGPLWNDIITRAYAERDAAPFPQYTGELVGNPVLDGDKGGLYDGASYRSILYYIDKDDPRGEGNSRQDSQFSSWDSAARVWSGNSAPPPVGQEEHRPPPGADDIDIVQVGAQENPIITFINPPQTLSAQEGARVEVAVASLSRIQRITISLDDAPIFSKEYELSRAPSNQSIATSILPSSIQKNFHTLYVEAESYAGRVARAFLPLTVVGF